MLAVVICLFVSWWVLLLVAMVLQANNGYGKLKHQLQFLNFPLQLGHHKKKKNTSYSQTLCMVLQE
jgi:hypothetical protein